MLNVIAFLIFGGAGLFLIRFLYAVITAEEKTDPPFLVLAGMVMWIAGVVLLFFHVLVYSI